MNKWQLHEAKNKLTNIIDIAMHGTPLLNVLQKGVKKQL